MFYHVEIHPGDVRDYERLTNKIYQMEKYCQPIELIDDDDKVVIVVRNVKMKYLDWDSPQTDELLGKLRFKLSLSIKDFYSEYMIKECVRSILTAVDFWPDKFFIFKLHNDGEFDYDDNQ